LLDDLRDLFSGLVDDGDTLMAEKVLSGLACTVECPLLVEGEIEQN
jgi:hypothetical protein